jgi:ubiquinone/menaquinone biosynthesis C-methylase UbiE
MLRRRYDPEIMDDDSIRDGRIDRALGELKQVNTFLGGRATTRTGFQVLRKKLGLRNTLSVLDVGAGGADVFDDSVHRLEITVLDRNPRVCDYLKTHVPYSVVCADARQLPFDEKSYDVVHISLFLHHLDEEEIREMLSCCLRISRRGIIINDLRRSIFAYAGIKTLVALFSNSAMVTHDAPLSVLRGFSKQELKTLLADCGVTKYTLQRRWAFRWLVVIWW